MYAMFDVVYGAYIEGDKIPDESILEGMFESDNELYEQPYNGSGDGWGYVGVVISSFDECDVTDMDLLDTKPNREQQEQAENAYLALPEKERALLSKLGVWIIPSTS